MNRGQRLELIRKCENLLTAFADRGGYGPPKLDWLFAGSEEELRTLAEALEYVWDELRCYAPKESRSAAGAT